MFSTVVISSVAFVIALLAVVALIAAAAHWYPVSSTSVLPVHDANTRGLLQYIATGEIIENHNFRYFNNPDKVPDVQSFSVTNQ